MTRLITTFFYIGLLRPAPGTWGSLAAIPAAWGLHAIAGFPALFLATGLVAALGWWATTEEIRDRADKDPGEIVIDEEGRTNLPGVFAAGDVTTVPYKQIVVAMGEGSKAGLSAFDYLIRNEPVEEVAQAA